MSLGTFYNTFHKFYNLAGLILVSNYTELILIAILMGLAKGVRTVYMIVVIPSHVSIEKLASASGIRMVSNGLVLLLLGPFVGKLTKIVL